MTEEMDKCNQFLVIDLGTEAIRVIIARLESDGSLKILGCSDTLSNRGSSSARVAANIRKGIVCNIQDVTRLLQQAINEAMLKAGILSFDGNVYLGITAGVTLESTFMSMKTGHSQQLVTQDDMAILTRKTREHFDYMSTTEKKSIQTYMLTKLKT